jgi:hypothetical protein
LAKGDASIVPIASGKQRMIIGVFISAVAKALASVATEVSPRPLSNAVCPRIALVDRDNPHKEVGFAGDSRWREKDSNLGPLVGPRIFRDRSAPGAINRPVARTGS